MDQYNNQSKSGESDAELSSQPTMFVRKDSLPQQLPPEEPKQSPQAQVEPIDSAGYDFAPTVKRSAVSVGDPAPVLSSPPTPDMPQTPPQPVHPQAAYPPPPPPQQPVASPPQKGKKNVWLIVVIVLVLLICCCCLILVLVPSAMGPALNDIFGNIMESLPAP